MKKFLSIIGAAALSLSLVACGAAEEETTENATGEERGTRRNKQIVVGASAVPHTEILEAAQAITC